MIKTDEEIELLRLSGDLVSQTLAEVGKIVQPGISTAKLDAIAETFIRDHHGIPGFKGYGGFPATLCTSVNDQVVHGIPSEKVILQEGDIVSVDCGAILNGYNGDSAYTFCVGEVSDEVKQLLEVTKASLYKGIEKATTAHRMGDIGSAVQDYCEKFGFGVVREMVGHGIGKKLHENPEVPNYGHRGAGSKLHEGLVICIEPMITLGKKEIYQERDGWSIRTRDHQYAAHFELTVAIGKSQADVLSTFAYIEGNK